MSGRFFSAAVICCAALNAVGAEPLKPSRSQLGKPSDLDAAIRRDVKDVARLAYVAVYDGWSTDEVLLQDELNSEFLSECRRRMPEIRDFDFNWSLLNLRKAGELKDVRTTKRRRDNADDYLFAAEIAARFLEDRHGVNTDRVICEPALRAEFDRIAGDAASGTSKYLLRKASLTLRKSRRLQPELVLRVADWKKTVTALSAREIFDNPDHVPNGPGVYIFRDSTGYLYIGESSKLRERLTKHLDDSDRMSLASYLKKNGAKAVTIEVHAFDPTSQARLKPMRRAYESELIRSRKPRFNLAP